MKKSKFFPISSDASFSDRLTAICNYRNIQTDAELARIICRHKEETNDPNVNESTFLTIKTRISHHRQNKNKYGNIYSEYIKDYCDALGCEPGYLLGMQDDYNRGITDSAREIGLDSQSIEHLKEYPPEIRELLDKMILHSGGDNLLKLLQAIQVYALNAQQASVRLEVTEADMFETQDIEDKLIGAIPEIGNTLPDISKRMLRYTATTAFDEILLDTYDDYVEDGNRLLKDRINRNAAREKEHLQRLKEKHKNGLSLNASESNSLSVGVIGNHLPSEEEAFAQIDKEAKRKYQIYKKKPSSKQKK